MSYFFCVLQQVNMKKTARHLLGVIHLVANHINPPSSYWGKNVFKKKKAFSNHIILHKNSIYNLCSSHQAMYFI